MSMIANSYGLQIDYEDALKMMNPQLRDELEKKIASDPCSDQEFFDAYAELHLERTGEKWSADTEKPNAR